MSTFEYKVVPFVGKIKGNPDAQEVAKQLAAAISQHATNGWILHSFNKVSIEVAPGCLAGLLGGKTAYVDMDQLIFVKST